MRRGSAGSFARSLRRHKSSQGVLRANDSMEAADQSLDTCIRFLGFTSVVVGVVTFDPWTR